MFKEILKTVAIAAAVVVVDKKFGITDKVLAMIGGK